jgi:hypothetical protein
MNPGSAMTVAGCRGWRRGRDADVAIRVSGCRRTAREMCAFELEAFFTFSEVERQLIEQRRTPSLKLGLALQIGFLRMSGRLLDAFRIVPANLWRHLGAQFAVEAPDLASLRALYRRGNTLFEHQQLACQVLGFRWMSEHQRRYLVRSLHAELERTNDRDRLVLFARRWLHEHRLIITHGRLLRKMIAKAVQRFENALAATIEASVGQALLERWRTSVTGEHGSGLTVQTWLWATPTRRSGSICVRG